VVPVKLELNEFFNHCEKSCVILTGVILDNALIIAFTDESVGKKKTITYNESYYSKIFSMKK